MRITTLVFTFLLANQLSTDRVSAVQPEGDQRAIQGRWVCTLFQRAGVIDENYQRPVLVSGTELSFKADRGPDKAYIILDPSHSPRRLIWKHETEVFDQPVMCEFRGIYLLEGNTILICVSDRTKNPTPESFESTKSNGRALMILKRESGAKHEAKEGSIKGSGQ